MINKQRIRRLVPPPLRPFASNVRRAFVANPFRIGWQRARLLRATNLSAEQRARIQAVDIRIHPRDGMYAGNGEDYFRAGLSAVECIDKVLSTGQFAEVGSVLDMPCGYGRELRFLVQRFPHAQFTACDIQRSAADFCQRAFGASAAYSEPDIRNVGLPRTFDLVWCGSLVTHLSRTDVVDLLKMFSRYHNSNGVIIITTNGEFVASQMRAGATYDLPRSAISDLLADYEQTGCGYQDYPRGEGYFDFHPSGTGYGVSLTSLTAVREIASEVGDLEEVFLKERGWAEHQDVFAFRKR